MVDWKLTEQEATFLVEVCLDDYLTALGSGEAGSHDEEEFKREMDFADKLYEKLTGRSFW